MKAEREATWKGVRPAAFKNNLSRSDTNLLERRMGC